MIQKNGKEFVKEDDLFTETQAKHGTDKAKEIVERLNKGESVDVDGNNYSPLKPIND